MRTIDDSQFTSCVEAMEAEMWGSSEDERLDHTDIDDYIESALDSMHPDPLPESIEACGYVRCKPNRAKLADYVLCVLLDTLDEEYSDPEEGPTGSTESMRTAAATFVESVLGAYRVWSCEPTVTVVVDVMAWVKKNNPEWLEEGK